MTYYDNELIRLLKKQINLLQIIALGHNIACVGTTADVQAFYDGQVRLNPDLFEPETNEETNTTASAFTGSTSDY